MAKDSRSDNISVEAAHLCDELTSQLGVPDSNPELLDGTSGAALVLHTVGGATEGNAVRWDRLLLLS
jgi:hypothetical protein